MFWVVATIAAIVAAAGLALVWAVGQYNRLMRARHEINNAAAQIQVELQARHDLVPALVECVRGHADHEREVIEGVVNAHSRALQVTGLSAETFSRENALSAALLGFQRVFSVGYPSMKSDVAFVRLSDRLVEIQERLSRSRQYYNDAVYRFASNATQFPGMMFAEIVGIREIPPYFQAIDGAEHTPTFSLSRGERKLPATSDH
jgi:LemA protein